MKYMTTEENFAFFNVISEKTSPPEKLILYIDSFDNIHFDVRLGTIERSVPLGTIIASTDEELNKHIQTLLSIEKCVMYSEEIIN